jgi:hypothetical protein
MTSMGTLAKREAAAAEQLERLNIGRDRSIDRSAASATVAVATIAARNVNARRDFI